MQQTQKITTLINKDNIEIRYVYHISDIHIRTLKRIQEYREVFDRTKEILKKYIGNDASTCLIVVTGDIMHSKTELSPEAIDTANYFFASLTEVCNVIIIAGNHDCNLSNLNRTDALSPIIRSADISDRHDLNDPMYKPFLVKKISNHNLYYLRKSGVYRYHNIMFGFTAVMDDHILLASMIDKTDFDDFVQANKYKIALYHGTINGSINDNNYPLRSKLTTKTFMGYDYVMLGDIHKYQFLDKDKTVAYAGSLIQQDHGETIENHGILKWDLAKNKKRYIEVPNDYGYCTINIVDGVMVKTRIPNKPRIKYVLDNTTHEQYLEVKNNLGKKYNIQEQAKNPSTKLRQLNGNVIIHKENNNDAMHIDKITKYLQAKGKSPEIIESVIKLHKETYGDIAPKNKVTNQNNQYWEIIEVQFSNVLSYGKNNVIDFSQYQPNQVIGIFAPNHYGKSTIIDVILFCLFDKWSRGTNADILNKNSKNMSCSLKFKIGEIVYVIEKKGTKAKKGTQVKISTNFYSITNGNKVILNGTKTTETAASIRAIVGDYDDFLTTCVCLQQAKNNFIDMTSQSQMSYLQGILNIDIFDECCKKTKDTLIEAKNKVASLHDQLQVHDIEALKKSKKDLKKCIQKLQKDLAFNKETLELLKMFKREHPGKDPREKTNTRLENYDLTSDAAILESIQHLKNKQDNIGTDASVDEEYQTVIDQLESTTHDIEIIEAEIKTLENNIINVADQYYKYDIAEQKKIKAELEDAIDAITNDISKYDDVEMLYNNVGLEIAKLEKSITYVNPNTDDLLTNIDEKIIENEKLLLDNYDQINHHIGINHADHIEDIINRIESCMDQNLPEIRKSLQLIVDENKKWLDSNKQTDKSIDITRILELSVKLHSDKMQLEIDSIALHGAKTARKKIIELKNKQYEYEQILKAHGELDILNGKLDNIKNIIAQLTQIENNKHNGKKLQSARAKYDGLVMVKEQLEAKVRSYQVQANNDRKSIKTDIMLLEKYRMKVIDWEYKIEVMNNIDGDIHDVEAAIIDNNKKLQKAQIDYENIQKELKLCDAISKSYHENFKKHEIYMIYKELMAIKGLASVMVKDYLPLIASEVNNVLSSFIDFTIEFMFHEPIAETKKPATKGKAKRNKSGQNKKQIGSINVYICYPDMERYNVTLASGFEKFIVGISLRIAMNHISLSAKPNFIVIDEGWSCMDNENRNNIDVVMNYIKSMYDHVIIISHLEELKLQAEYNIGIERIKGFSHVSNLKASERNAVEQNVFVNNKELVEI